MNSGDGLLSPSPNLNPVNFSQTILLTESNNLTFPKPDPNYEFDTGLLNDIHEYEKDRKCYMNIINCNYKQVLCNNNNNNSFNHKNKKEDTNININKECMIYYKGEPTNKIRNNLKKFNVNNNNYRLPPSSHDNKVINLSSFSFPPSTFNILGKGLNFALAPRKILIEDIICDVEFRIRGLPDNIKDTIRQDCAVVFRKEKPPNNNINKDEFNALQSLNQNKDIWF